MKLIKLWNHLSKRRHKQFGILVILMFIVSLFEVISIGSIIPFLGVLSAPEQVFQHQLTQPFLQFFYITEPSQLLLPLTVIFSVAALAAGVLRIILLYTIIKLSFAVGSDLSVKIFQHTLSQNYSVHLLRSSSEVINGIIMQVNIVITSIVAPFFRVISSVILFTGIMTALFILNTKIALISFAGFGVIYWIIMKYTNGYLSYNSKIITTKSALMIKTIQEGLGGIRDIIIDNNHQLYYDAYQKAELSLRRAAGNNQFISGSPRYILEALGMSIVALLAYMMIQESSTIIAVIPILGAFALGAQRMLPALQQAYAAYSNIKGATSSLENILEMLQQPIVNSKELSNVIPIKFEKEIQLTNLSFSYMANNRKDQTWVLNDINLNIPKGSRVGIIGATGSGKSTLIDLIMGLLSPTSGKITIDNEHITSKNIKAWQAHIAHVPQNIYLSDSTIEENIAFGVPKENINHQNVEKAAKQAHIAKLVETWKDGYKTFVGERGVRLSGGQRQRIGIARALYKQANVLVFDEATSALDNKTEKIVIDALDMLEKNLTIFIIAHRLTTLKCCDMIIKLDKNNIVNIGSHQDMINYS